jgi:uncharacterized protein
MATRKKAGTSKKSAKKAVKAPAKRSLAKTSPKKAAKKPAKKAVKKAVKKAAKKANRWFELRRSDIQGLGAFAIRDIPRGQKLIEYTGERISQDEADRRYDDEKMKRHHTFLFTLDDGTCIDAAHDGNEARFINHSCDPNCEAVIEGKRIFIYSKRRIPEGQELVYDYQFEYQDDYTKADERFYACRCGSPKCRGTILMPKKKSSRARR